MNIYIYDIEVLSDDWIVDFSRPDLDAPHITIHNDNARLRAFLDQPDLILGGFNNKHYDDYIVLTMIFGGSNIEVKKHNDWIIAEKRKPWEFPFVQFKRKPFKSFDLKDDIADEAISLKAIEGNLKLPIVESSIPFDVGRKLTKEELEEVIKYCQYDVDSTKRLYWERKANYLDAKVLAGSLYSISPEDSLSYTNARLSAEALEAKYTDRNDERDYVIPEKLPVDRIPKEVYDFFMTIRDKSIPDEKLFKTNLKFMLITGGGVCPVTFAWGGVHGAVPCVTVKVDDEYVLINQDVGSLYPNSKLNFGYCSRSMKDPDAYRKLVELRLDYKAKAKAEFKLVAEKLDYQWLHEFEYEDQDGNTHFDFNKAKASVDAETYQHIESYFDYDNKQSSLKLIINTCYGAMLVGGKGSGSGNGLCDRLHARSVCITNQICMAILISDLAKECESIWFININTDGIMYRIKRSEADKAQKIIDDWCVLTGFSMEEDNFSTVIQKDVNNYIGIYDNGKFKTKGGYVSLYDGGNFKTNNLQIIHKAIVDNLVKGIDPETTIRECKDIFAFQQIVKTGGSYEGSYQYINGERIPIQKVNRIYATNHKEYGTIVKGKWIKEKRKKNKETGKMESIPIEPVWSEDTISECPTHAYIDNTNQLTVEDLDLDYYISMAKDRIDKYINISTKVQNELNKITKEVVIMATKQNVSEKEMEEIRGLNVESKLVMARNHFANANVKKTGKNTYAEFKYFTLEDIIPVKNTIFANLGLVDVISFGTEVATLTLINADNPEQTIEFMSPLKEDESLIKNPIQKLGAVETYVRRYLYLLLLDIVEADTVDAASGKDETTKAEKPKSKKPVSESERQETKKELINEGGEATDTQIKAIKNGLKKLRAAGNDEDYVSECIKKLKAGITNTEAEAMMIEIGDKLN